MVITDRVQTENTPRVTPLVSKRSSNIRLSTSYDPNCDNSGRINDHISEQSISNISLNQNQSMDYLSANSLSMKKDRICLESNIDGRNGGSIRLCNSQSNDLNKPDSVNRQFSPWNAPVRNRVVARVVPYPHTSSNGSNISHSNSSLTSKSIRDIQSTIHSVRGSNSAIQQTLIRNGHKSYSSYAEKEISSSKQDSTISVNHNLLHLVNDRDSYNDTKRRPNYNQQVTYRVKNTDSAQKPFDVRNASFSGGHGVKSRGYRYSDLVEGSDKPVTAAQVFGEDFSDLSDNESTTSYTSPTAVVRHQDSRNRKSVQVMKRKRPSSDSSSTMSVQSAEKQNRFVRVSKPHFHSKNSSLHHSLSIHRSKNSGKIKTSSSSEDQRHGKYSSKISRHNIKFSIQEKPEKKNISMKPLTVNVSLSNFEDNVLDSDEISSRSTENSSQSSSKRDGLQKNKLSPLQMNNKRKWVMEKSGKYRTKEQHSSSSSDNDDLDYNNNNSNNNKVRRYQISGTNTKKYKINEHDNRNMCKYMPERAHNQNKYTSNICKESNIYSTKKEVDYGHRKMSHNNSSHNFMVERQYHDKDDLPIIYRDKDAYLQKRERQISESPPVKRQKIKNDISDTNPSIYRSLDKSVPMYSQHVQAHKFGKHHKPHQELSLDAAFQKEFDEFKKDQAGDLSQVSGASKKCNSSILSSASSTGTKSFSSFKKYKSKKQERYDEAVDTKNIFQIDLDNINMFESMYDKVKRRTHKQTESGQHAAEVSTTTTTTTESRNKKKSKPTIKETKHFTNKDTKRYQRKSLERMVSRSSSLYSSPLVGDDSVSNYSSTKYSTGALKGMTNHKEATQQQVHNEPVYKSTKTKTAPTTLNAYSKQSWLKKEQEEEEERLFYMRKKYKAESKVHRNKFPEKEDHDDNSEFSYVTNVSNAKTVSSTNHARKEREEIGCGGNGSDGTASTEPMEYVEVDFQSPKLSDDDWKSGLTSQSSNSSSGGERGGDRIKDMERGEALGEKVSRMTFGEKRYSPRSLIYGLETEGCERKEGGGFLGTGARETAQQEQDLAIASIMLKEEGDCSLGWGESRTEIVEMSETSEGPVRELQVRDPEILVSPLLLECERLEELPLEETAESIEVGPNLLLCEAKCTDLSKEVRKSTTPEPVLDALKVNDTEILVVKTKEGSSKNHSVLGESISEPVISTGDSLQDNVSITNSVTSASSKMPSSGKSVGASTGPTDKEHLTSYVKSVIERVMQEQSVENQNKLRVDKTQVGGSRRSKRTSGGGGGSSAAVVSGGRSVSVSTTLQKSPSISLQAVVLEINESPKVAVSRPVQTIPGVNVCSPVTTSTVPTDVPGPKPTLPRANVISIINLSSGTPSLKVDPPLTLAHTPSSSSSSSELKVNTDWTSATSVLSDVSSVITDTNSTHTPSLILKSAPTSDDHTKQRICTRLRRADPTKSDGNYRVVMTNSSTNISAPESSNKEEHKVPDQKEEVTTPATTTEGKTPVKMMADPYEPNFDESPLELCHYRTKTKNMFFPSEERSATEETSTSIQAVMTTSSTKSVSVVTTTSTASVSVSLPPPSSSSLVMDSVSQIIDDVAHGNFNYGEYLSSFKSGRLPSSHISPSTTPLTFVSTDSRDCSSASQDAASVSGRKSSNNGSKLDNIHKHIVSTMMRGTLAGIVDVAASRSSPDKMTLMNAESSGHRTKTPTSLVSISPMFSTSNHASYQQKDIFALINQQTVPSKTDDHTSQKTKPPSRAGESSQNYPLTSIQIQPFKVLANEISLNQFQLNIDSNLQQKVSNGSLLNISINSAQPSSNSILSSSIQNSDEKMVLNQFYLNVLKQRTDLGAFDSSAFSHLQNILNQTHLKQLNSSVENNPYRPPHNVSSFESSSLPSSHSALVQDSINPSLSAVTQNISSKFIAELIIPRDYPLVWEGKLSLKNEEAKVALHFVHGNSDLLNACMHLLIFSGSLQWNNTGSLKIVQRMRLDISQLEGVQRRMQNSNEFCIGLALPGGDDTTQWMRQSQILKEGFIKYMREKGAAGIINVCHPDNNQQGLYVVHIFPPCEFSNSQLCSAAPQLASIIESNKIPSLLVIITTV